MSTATFNVTGMHCSSCSMLVTMNLEDTSGVTAVDCNHATGRTVVTFDGSKTTPADLRNVIVGSGYSAELVN